ncbi:MAG: CHAT domain-containing protein [Acidobacteria bacterium]|nr:CHAT domain-containing protein [Acidobacteriota bacterium]
MKILSVLLSLCLLLPIVPVLAQDPAPVSLPPDAQSLEVGKPITATIKGTERHTYRLRLAKGQFCLVQVEQLGGDLVLEWFASDGTSLGLTNRRLSMGTEQAVFLAEQSSLDVKLEVRPRLQPVNPREYRIQIAEVREATQYDTLAVAAQQAYRQAGQFSDNKAGKPDYQKAIEKYQSALNLYRLIPDPVGEGYALHHIARAHMRLNQRDKALDFFQQALKVWDANQNKLDRAITLNSLCFFYINIGELTKSAMVAREAIEIFRQFQDQDGEAGTLNNLANTLTYLGDIRQGQECLNRVLAIDQANGSLFDQATTLNNLAGTYDKLGETQRARACYEQALELRRFAKDRQGEAFTLINISVNESRLSNFQQAIQLIQQAQGILKELNDQEGQAYVFSNLALYYKQLGDPARTLEYMNEAASLWKTLGSQRQYANMMVGLGRFHAETSDYAQAKKYYTQALDLSRTQGYASIQEYGLTNLGVVFLKEHDFAQAEKCFSEALAVNQKTNDLIGRAFLFDNLADLNIEKKDYQAARQYLEQSLALNTQVAYAANIAENMYSIAIVDRQEGKLLDALNRMEQAIPLFEQIRSRVDDQRLRTTYFSSNQIFYDFYLQLLMDLHEQFPEQGYAALALQAKERATARGLIELLREAKTDIRQGVDPHLIQREAELNQRLGDKATRITEFLSRNTPSSLKESVEREFAELNAEYRQVQAEIRQKSPGYAAITQNQSATLADIQNQLLDDTTQLVEFALTPEESFVWLVSRQSIEVFSLPPKDEIERRASRVYELLTVRNLSVTTTHDRKVQIAKADLAFPAAARELSQLLFGQFANKLTKKRLLIVPDGRLQSIPFGALPLPSNQTKSATEQPFLIEQHELVVLPSATTLLVKRQQPAAPPQLQSKKVLVVADPVFDLQDSRMAEVIKNRPDAMLAEARNLKSLAEIPTTNAIQRLVFTRQEATQISRLLKPDEGKQLLDFDASRQTVLAENLNDYRMLHFATHGIFNRQTPELSGLVLSQINRNGEPENGFLSLTDVFNLRLNSDLVVLSACQTALGTNYWGEGMVGLTRGFLYAGTNRVVSSLWMVDDSATSELMTEFYRRMLGKDRLSPAAALRAAQLKMLNRSNRKHPFYWAAFQVQGEF